MKIAEFFAELGVVGSEKTIGSLTQIDKGFVTIAGSSLEAKAAMIGALYALERMFSASGTIGTGLSQFTTLTGRSAEVLQVYQRAANQVGVQNEDVTSSFKNLQSAMAKMVMGEGAPKGLGLMVKTLKDSGINVPLAEINKWISNPDALIQRLQQFAKVTSKPGMEAFRNEVLRSFGVSDPMIVALSKGAFSPEKMKGFNVYSQNQIESLQKIKAEWGNVFYKIEKFFGDLNSKHGREIVGTISDLTDVVLRLAKALEVLGEDLGVFKFISNLAKDLNSESKEGAKNYRNWRKDQSSIDPSGRGGILEFLDRLKGDYSTSPSSNSTSVTVNQSFAFGENGDPNAENIMRLHKQAASDAYFQKAGARKKN